MCPWDAAGFGRKSTHEDLSELYNFPKRKIYRIDTSQSIDLRVDLPTWLGKSLLLPAYADWD
jgi:hypothetical protein